jgi:hypothetical protein
LWYTFDQGFDEPLKQKRGCTAVRKTWWRVPAYCIAAFVLGSQLVMFLESLGWPMELCQWRCSSCFWGGSLLAEEGDPSLRVDCGGISGFARRGPVHLHLSSGEREAHDRLSEQCGFDGIHSGYGGRKDRPYQVSLWQIFRYADPRMLFRQIKMGMYPYLFVCFGKKEEAKPPEDGRRDSGDDGAETL